MRALLLAGAAALAAAQTVRDDFDCAMRHLALDFASHIQPFRSLSVLEEIAAALDGTPEKAPGCAVNASRLAASAPAARSRFPHISAPPRAPGAGGATFYVALDGSDAAAGTLAAPFATLARALAATRATPGTDTILLRGGTYFSQPTQVLTPLDSGLTISNFPGEEVWLSGSAPLPAAAAWRPYNVSNSTPPVPPAPAWIVEQGMNDVYANAGGAYEKGKTPTWQACQALCQSDGACRAWTWHDASQGSYALACFFRPDGQWAPVAEAGHVAGYYGVPPQPTLPNIWAVDLSGAGVEGIAGLRGADGARLTRARFPNGFPETKGFMPPAVFRAAWTPQSAPRAPATQIDLPKGVIDRNTSVSAFQTFTAGIGGTCERFSPPCGYWCSNAVQGGGSVIYYVPTAMQATQATLPHTPYSRPQTAIVHTWRPGHWASWMYQVGGATFDSASGTTNFSFSSGGFQGSRGADSGEDSFVENVFEELDAPSEWFFDADAGVLYLWHNETPGTPPPSALVWTPPANKHLFNITGTMASPVKGVSLLGLGFRDTAYTFMDGHSLPSGGDWSLERSAVVLVEGTEGTNISGCVFERVDGNAVLLSAYNRHVEVSYNDFAWIGATAVALWGNTESTGGADSALAEGYGGDGTSGNQPRFSLIAFNLCRELGVWEKQSSCYTQFKSGFNTVRNNIMYNGPRAHINFNDGFAGGALVTGNLVFNSCRESGDHGPFNSWDRDPYLFTDPDTGAPTTVKKFDEISRNFIVANYNSLGAVDNDDGSSYYYTHDNFFSYGGGGLKNDFQGHDNIWERNIVAFIESYCIHNGYGGGLDPVLPGHEQQLVNNTCVLTREGAYGLPICTGADKSVMGGNAVFSPLGNISECGHPLAEWQAMGNDPGTTGSAYTASLAADLIAQARQLIFV